MPATMDGLADGDPLVITREVFLPVAMTLAARPGRRSTACARWAAIRTPSPSAPAGWPRICPAVMPLPFNSTATAAAAVAAGELDAAVCAPIAAERYGLTTLVDDIADHQGAVTRFVLVARPGELPAPTATTRRRWSPSSGTAPAPCWRCSRSSPSGGSA